MSGFKLGSIGVIAVIMVMGLLFTGNPGICGAGDVNKVEVLPVLNKINRLIGGEVKSISLADDELIAIFAERLDPRVRNFKICLDDDQVGVSGQTTNRIGLTVKFKLWARVSFEKNYPQISELELAVGRVNWSPRYIQKMVNRRLSQFNFGKELKVEINSGAVILENYD